MKKKTSKIISLVLAAVMAVSGLTYVSYADNAAVGNDDIAVIDDAVASGDAVTSGSGTETEPGGGTETDTLGPAEAGKTYTVDFTGLSEELIKPSYTSEDNIFRYTNASGRFHSASYGIAPGLGDKFEIAVAGAADISFTLSQYAAQDGIFTVTNSAGEEVGTLSAYVETDKTANTFEYKGEATVLTFTYSAGSKECYVPSITVINSAGPIGQAESFEFWLDDKAVDGVVEPGVYPFADSKIELVGNGDEKYTAFQRGLSRGGKENVNAYKAGSRHKTANDIPTIPTQGEGTCVVFTPAADGTFNVYFYTTAVLRAWDFNADGTRNGYADSPTAAESYAVNAKAGHVYVFSTTGSTNNTAFAGFEYIVDEPVSVNLSWTEDGKYDYSKAEISFVDTAFGTTTETVANGADSVKLMKGHTYELVTNDGGVRAQVGGSSTFKADGAVTIDLTVIADQSLSGKVLGDASAVSAIKFVNMVNGNETEAVYNSADGTYTASIKPGDYNTVVTAEGYYTKDRVKVVENADNKNDIFLEALGNATYDLGKEVTNASSVLKMTGFKFHSAQYGIAGGVGSTIVIPVSGKQTITASGSYDGRFSLVGNGAASQKVDSGNTFSAAYTTADDDTEVTLTIEETGNVASGSGSAYLSTIKTELVKEPVAFKSTINVPEDYATLNEAVAAIKLMADRPEGEAGRVTIELHKTVQEQVVFDAPNITLNGNGNEINWYYGVTGKYYSVGADGLYNESLFYDKYEKTEGNGSLWGGVAIIRGDNFIANNTTFRNTFNYEVTDKEIEDGAEGRGKIAGLITKDTDVQAYNAKERSNAFYIEAKNIQVNNCNILASQDTFGRNGSADGGYSVYVKDSVIGGNVDYICGEFKAVFENCELQWKTYPNNAKENNGIGYIVAPKTNPYVFIDCTITTDLNPGTGNENTPVALADETNVLGKFGRTWGAGSAAYFINCETSGSIDNEGWGEMTAGDGDSSKFFEFGNTNGGEPFATAGKFTKALTTKSELGALATDPYYQGIESFKNKLDSEVIPELVDDNEIRGDIDGNGYVSANDAAVLLAYVLSPDKVNPQWNVDFYHADVAGTYMDPEAGVQSIDATDAARILAYVLNAATPFNDVETGKDPVEDASSEATTEAVTTDDSSETTTEGSVEEKAVFSDTDNFTDANAPGGIWYQENSSKADIDMADVTDVAGNTSAKIKVANKSVFKQVDTIDSGNATLTMDFLSTGADSSGRTFRVYLENGQEPVSGDKSVDEFKGADNKMVFYHLCDIGGRIYSVTSDTPGASAVSTATVVDSGYDIEPDKWYRLVIDLDFDSGRAVTNMYMHGADGTYAGDVSTISARAADFIPVIENMTSPLVAGKDHKLSEIKLVRTASGSVYFDNMSLSTSPSGGSTPDDPETTTDAVTETTTVAPTPENAKSFIWWFDEANDGGVVAPGTYTAGDGAADIIVVPGLAGESYSAQNAEFEYEGVTHKPYKSSNRPDSAGSLSGLPTAGCSYIVDAKVNGTATFYNYVPASKNFTIMDYANGAVVNKYATTAPDSNTNDSYTLAVEAGHQYACYATGTNGLWFYGVKFLMNEPVDVPVKLNVKEGTVNTDLIEVSLLDVDTNAAAATIKKDTTSITLNKGHTYELRTNDGGVEAQLGGALQFTFKGDEASLDIDLIELNSVTLSGPITATAEGVGAASIKSITFTKMNDANVSYTFTAAEAVKEDGTYSVQMKPGDYNTKVETTDGSFTNDRVKIVKDTDCVNEIYLEVEETAPTDVEFKAAISVPGDYATIKEALAAVKGMTNRPAGEEGRVTITVTEDIEEQVVVDADYISIVGAPGEKQPEITWYYGIGTSYYSIDSNGYYNESLFRDKYSSRDAASGFWGGVVIVMGNYFKAEDITFRNTYNYWVTEKDQADVANCTKGERVIGADVKTNKYRERSNALALNGDNSEYYNCTILSSQDTLGWNGSLDNHAYFKDCTIGGNCDYICGAGTLVFDDCDLVWFTEGNNVKSLGYVTAPRSKPYIFRNCNIVTDGDEEKTAEGSYGLFGRPWGGTDATAYFIGCETNGTIGTDGWTGMGSTKPENAKFYEKDNTNGGNPFAITEKGKAPADDDPFISADDAVFMPAAFGTWVPTYYGRTE